MVLEHIFPEDWLEHKGRYAFILGALYSVVGVLLAGVLFGSDPALPAVAFTSLLVLPEMYKIFSIEERKERLEKKVTLAVLWRDDIELIRIYTFLFLGMFVVYAAAPTLFASFGDNQQFREQLELRVCPLIDPNNPNCQLDVKFDEFKEDSKVALPDGFFGSSFKFDMNKFLIILQNNFVVLLACFILALLTGDGAIFFITWNASVWGSIFGVTAKIFGILSATNGLIVFGILMLMVGPHMCVEILSYFLAAISGSVISKDVLLEEFASDRFFEVFTINLYLLLIALVVLVLGAGIETFALDNFEWLRSIYSAVNDALRAAA